MSHTLGRRSLLAGGLVAPSALRAWAQSGASPRWNRLAGLPIPVFLGPAVAAVNDKLYVVGGMTRNGEVYAPSNKVQEYDPGGDRWTEKANMPAARRDLAVVASDGAIYALGGTELDDGGRGSRRAERFDISSGSWSAVAAMPTPRCHLAAASVRGRIITFGGRQGSLAVEEYDPREDRWRSKAHPPSLVPNPFAVTAGNWVLIIGGTTNGNEDYSVVHRYDPAADSWAAAAPMPVARTDIAVATLAGSVFVFGGWTRDGLTARVDCYDVTADRWLEVDRMPRARSFAGAAAIGRRVYVVGGAVYVSKTSLVPISDAEVYSPA